MEKRLRKERSLTTSTTLTSSESPPEGRKHPSSSSVEVVPSASLEDVHKKGGGGFVERFTKAGGGGGGKTAQRTDSDRTFRKQSKIHELLSNFKEDVVQMRESDMLHDDMLMEPQSLSILPGQSNYQRQFTRVSPNKINNITNNEDQSNNNSTKATNKENSKWGKALRLSRTMMSRPKQTLSKVSRGLKKDGQGGNGYQPSDEDVNNSRGQKQTKLIGLLRIIDHGSCISSGILSGLLLWTTINAISWHNGSAQNTYNENFIRLYYSTAVVLTYVALIGFIIRIYTSWTRVSGILLVYIGVLISILIFHYVNKGYDQLRLECDHYNRLTSEMKAKVIPAHSCPVSMSASMSKDNSEPQPTATTISQQELILILTSNGIQTLGSIVLTCYFHFTPYVQPWFTSGSKIKSRQIMNP